MQFYRSFPHPSDINADDTTKLVKRYADPTRPGMVNYVNMHRDIEALEAETGGLKTSTVQEPLRKLTKPTYSKASFCFALTYKFVLYYNLSNIVTVF